MADSSLNQTAYSGIPISGGGTLLKNKPGIIRRISIQNPGTAWQIDVYDGLDSTSTRIGQIRGATAPSTVAFDTILQRGLFIDAVEGTATGFALVTFE